MRPLEITPESDIFRLHADRRFRLILFGPFKNGDNI
nr:MAG TPA: hypothetical protein [Caudoviricetes sp.]